MIQQHTPEPWATEYRKGGLGTYSQEVFDAEGRVIATMAWYPVVVPTGATTTNREANARRIVACVNACAGIPTQDLERVEYEITPVFELLVHVTKQRDELLAELKKAAAYHRSHECYSEAKRLEDYIASVKGGAA